MNVHLVISICIVDIFCACSKPCNFFSEFNYELFLRNRISREPEPYSLCAYCLSASTTMSSAQNATLSPPMGPTSPRVRRQPSGRRRAGSQLPPAQTIESHEAALKSIRAHLRSRTNYDSFPVSYRIIVLDTKLEVRKALQCLLYNGTYATIAFTQICVLYILRAKALCPPLCGTARRAVSLGCLRCQILFI